MAKAVTIVAAGGVGVTNLGSLSGFGTPMTPVDAGGVSVTLVDAGGLPVVLINNDGTLYSSEGVAAGIVLAAGGALYNPADLTSLYQSRTGGSTGASGSVVGIMLDKSYMGGQTAAAYIAGRPELIVNGNFANGSTGWTLDANWVVSNGKATYTDAGAVNYLQSTAITLTAGKWYRWTFEMSGLSADDAVIGLLDNAPSVNLLGAYQTITTNGEHQFIFRVASTVTGVRIYGNNGGSAPSWSITNITLKEIPGFHALAPSDAARPLLTVSGGLSYLVVDGVDDWMNVTPTLNLGEAWWHVGGWRSDTAARTAFGTSSSYRGALWRVGTEWIWITNTDNNTTEICTGSPASTAVITVEQAATAGPLSGRYNGGNGASLTPYDDSAATQGLALFSQQNNAWAAGIAGRFYGGAFAPGSLSTTDRAIMERYAATLAGVTLA